MCHEIEIQCNVCDSKILRKNLEAHTPLLCLNEGFLKIKTKISEVNNENAKLTNVIKESQEYIKILEDNII